MPILNKKKFQSNPDSLINSWFEEEYERIDSIKLHKNILIESYENNEHQLQVSKWCIFDIIKITDDNIIARIKERSDPFVIPKVDDNVYIE